ncbi:hypothetical protein KC19_8G134300 [Ceratodon purpureus]|uniref:ER membrane protein complex subunit 4 n=1 Tax=Ceratodon purpureus TaxID=3225 RepID=A0A8T0H309_CERPU|nr:hypothetical protein KC19_8G134300 [Ceratodon purpureus]
MERGSGRGARKWAVELHDANNTSSSRDAPPDPIGFSRSTVDPEETTSGKQKKENEANWKKQKAWEVAQAPAKNLMMMGFMMWMAGSTVHLFSIGITFSALWQPVSALQSIGKVFEPFQDAKTSTLLPKLLFVALNFAAMGLGLWKLNTLGLLPTHASDWLSNLAPAQSVEFSGGGLPLLL